VATQQLGLQLSTFEAGSEGAIDEAFAQAFRQQVHALLVSADPFFTIRRKQIVALASRHALRPCIRSAPMSMREGS